MEGMIIKRLTFEFRSVSTTSGSAAAAVSAGAVGLRHGGNFDHANLAVGGTNSGASARPDLLFCLKLKAM